MCEQIRDQNEPKPRALDALRSALTLNPGPRVEQNLDDGVDVHVQQVLVPCALETRLRQKRAKGLGRDRQMSKSWEHVQCRDISEVRDNWTM